MPFIDMLQFCRGRPEMTSSRAYLISHTPLPLITFRHLLADPPPLPLKDDVISGRPLRGAHQCAVFEYELVLNVGIF